MGSSSHTGISGAHSQGKQHTAKPRYSSPARQVLLGHAGELAGLAAGGRIRWAGYVSSTSVYGDWGGAWVDEGCGLPVTRPPYTAAVGSCLGTDTRARLREHHKASASTMTQADMLQVSSYLV